MTQQICELHFSALKTTCLSHFAAAFRLITTALYFWSSILLIFFQSFHQDSYLCSMCEALSLDLYREDNYSVMCLFQGVEDPLLELKTPTLFIIGSHSTLTSQEEVEVCFIFFFSCLIK